MRIMMHIFYPALFTVFVLAGQCSALQIEWAPIAEHRTDFLCRISDNAFDHSHFPFSSPNHKVIVKYLWLFGLTRRSVFAGILRFFCIFRLSPG